MDLKINLSEKSLATDINGLSREVLHNLFVVCRKAGIYSVHHPMVSTAVPRPFLGMQKVFAFKKYFTLVLIEGRLYANNIIVTDTGVTDFFKEKMHDLEMASILFEDTISVSDLETFVERFVKRMPTNSPDYFMHRFLESRKVYSIHINSGLSEKLFNTGLRYHTNVGEDFSVRKLVANYFSGDPQLAVTVISSRFKNTREQAEAAGIDYHVELVNHILPEKFTRLSPSELLDMADRILGEDAFIDDAAAVRMERLVRSFDYHPRRDELLDGIRGKFLDRGIDEQLLNKSLSQVGALKHEVAYTVDNILQELFSDSFEAGQTSRFHDAFMRLMRTGQMGKAAGVVESLVAQLTSQDGAFRQRAVSLLEDIVAAAVTSNEHGFLDIMLRHLQILFTGRKETYETTQIVGLILRSLLALRRFVPVADFLEILRAGRRMESDVVIYDSLTVKRIFEDIDNDEIISRLIRELELPGNSQIRPVRTILAAIQSERVALGLAEIVTHPERSVRQHCLKTLAELGWPAVNVFSNIIRSETNFLRPEGRNELPDNQWYLIRNAIFVLGKLGDPAACDAFRLRLADPDVRVRRELVRALEQIDCDASVDLLMILADDIDPSIRESAIITLGLFRRPDLVPFFIDLMSRHQGELQRIITAIANTRSPEARDFLTALRGDRDKLKSYAAGKASISDIAEWVESSLAKLYGDDSAFDDECSTERTSSQKPSLGRTAKLIIEKLYPKK